MSKAINIIGGLVILWMIINGIWRIGNFEGLTGDSKGINQLGGSISLSIGIILLLIVISIRLIRKKIEKRYSWFCPKCDGEMSESNKTCPKCGADLELK